jgi:hypothetical protein
LPSLPFCGVLLRRRSALDFRHERRSIHPVAGLSITIFILFMFTHPSCHRDAFDKIPRSMNTEHRQFTVLLMKVLALAILLPVFAWSKAAAQGDCQCRPVSSSQIANPDSIIIDTCGLGGDWTTCEQAATYADPSRMYADRWWHIAFEVDAIALPVLPSDSIVEVSWRSIDTAYHDLRSGFEAVEQTFGTVTLRKKYPQEATGEFARLFRMRIGKYSNVDSVTKMTDTIPDVFCGFDAGFTFPAGVVSPENPNTRIALAVRPNPAASRIQVCGAGLRADASLAIFDVTGRRVSLDIPPPAADGCSSVDVSRLSSGLYFIRSKTASVCFVVSH